MSEHLRTLFKGIAVAILSVGIMGIVGDASNLTGYDVFGVGFLACCFVFTDLSKEDN
jgi:hypothetical protein